MDVPSSPGNEKEPVGEAGNSPTQQPPSFTYYPFHDFSYEPRNLDIAQQETAPRGRQRMKWLAAERPIRQFALGAWYRMWRSSETIGFCRHCEIRQRVTESEIEGWQHVGVDKQPSG